MAISFARAIDPLEQGFLAPPDTAKPWVYWYWNHGNLTKEGITADLEDMKRQGIGGVLILDAAESMPMGVLDLSPAYWDLVDFSFKECARLGLQVNMGNCPSWSGDGGPWVTPEHAMKIVVMSEANANGPGKLSIALPQPPIVSVTVPRVPHPDETIKFYRDIAVLAFPTPNVDQVPFSDQVESVTTTGNQKVPNPEVLFDHNPDTTLKISGDAKPYVQFELKKPMSVQALSLKLLRPVEPVGMIDIQTSDDGAAFHAVYSFRPSRNHEGQFVRNPNPYSERNDVSFAPVSSKYFRIVFEVGGVDDVVEIGDVDFHGGVRITDLATKAGYQRVAGSPFDPKDVPLDPGTVIPKEQVVDLTKNLQPDGTLNWDAPPGKWTIIRYGYTLVRSTNQEAPLAGRGLESDKLSREASAAAWDDGVLKKFMDLAGPLCGKTLTLSHIDSYEEDCQNWTQTFREEFTKRRGYDPMPYFPVLTGRIVDSVAISERFLWDYRRTLADLMHDNWYAYFADYLHKRGLQSSIEPYGCGNFDWFEAGGTADVPSSEFWAGEHFTDADRLDIKRPPSSAHTWGKTVVNSEAFTGQPTSSKYLNYPYRLKNIGDQAFAMGVNHFVFHTYVAQPWTDKHLEPGMEFGPWGTEVGRTVTWWKTMGSEWLKYLARSEFLLQQGHFAADAIVFEGENEVPGYGAGRREDMSPQIPLGYDFDFCGRDVVLQRMAVKDGRIVLPDGMSYPFLVLNQSQGETPTMTPAVLKKIQSLVQDGATLLGRRPVGSPSLKNYPACDVEVKTMVDELWGDCDGAKVKEHAYGKGKVICGETFQQVAEAAGLPPDFDYACDNPKLMLNWIHRKDGPEDIYFVANPKMFPAEVTCQFRVAGDQPEFWHPDTGQVEDCAVFKPNGKQTQVPIHFDAKGSIFVIFRKPAMANPVVAVQAPALPAHGELTITKAHYQTDALSGDGVKALTALIHNGTLDAAVEMPIGMPWNARTLLDIEYNANGKTTAERLYGFESIHLPLEDAYDANDLYNVEQTARGTEAVIGTTGSYTFDFASGKKKAIDATVPAPVTVDGPWDLHFEPDRGAPDKVTLSKLISWSDHDDPGVKYFSGTATYVKQLDVPAALLVKDQRVYLDLGRVEVMADIKLNGKDLGVLWKPPFRVDITDCAKAGTNALEIQVVNLWPNRLIGDEQLPDDCEWGPHFGGGMYLKKWPSWLPNGIPNGQPRTNGRISFVAYKHWYKTDPLVKSGILGPVTLRVALVQPLTP